MKFRTERDGLLEALATASRAASARTAAGSASPSLQLVLHGNQLIVTGADPDLVIEVRTSVAGDADGAVLVPARLLVDIVRSFEPGAVTVTSDEEEARVLSGRAEFSVRVPVAAEVSRLSPAGGEGVSLPARRFAEGLRQVVRAALTDDTRAPQLTGVLMLTTGTGLRLVATDSYRLAFKDLAGMSGPSGGNEVLVPARALAEVQRLVGALAEGKESDDASPLVFRCGELDAAFDLGHVQLTTRLLRGPFPDYERLLPPSYPNSFTAAKEELAAALRRVRLMVRDTKDVTTPVRISFTEGGVELTVLTAETGRASERVDGSYVGEETTIAFNPGYLLDGIDAIRADVVTLEVIDSSKPATVRGEGEDDYRYLLMPVRVS